MKIKLFELKANFSEMASQQMNDNESNCMNSQSSSAENDTYNCNSDNGDDCEIDWLESIRREAGSSLSRYRRSHDKCNRLFESQHPLVRLVWLLCLASSSVAFVAMVANNLREYAEYKVTTHIRIEHEHQSTFPAITICNIHPFTTEYAAHVIKNLTIPNNNNNTISRQNEQQRAVFARYLNVYDSVASDEDKRRLGFSLERSLVSCRFSTSECELADFEWFWHKYNGNCYRFNGPTNITKEKQQRRLRRTIKPGMWNSFIIELYVGLADELSATTTSGRRGLYVLVSNASHSPYDMSPNFVRAMPGKQTSIAVDRWFYQKMPHPYSQCTVSDTNALLVRPSPLGDSRLFDQLRATNFTYTQRSCIDYCFQLHLSRKCGCLTNSVQLTVANTQYCHTDEQTECMDEFYKRTFSVGDFVSERCAPLCPIECARQEMVKSLSYETYPTSEAYVRELKSGRGGPLARASFDAVRNHSDFSDANLKHNLVKLSVFYESLSYKRVDESPALTVISLVANIGGYMSLFLGMSLLSFVTLFELAAQIVFAVFAVLLRKRKRRRRKQQQMKSDTLG